VPPRGGNENPTEAQDGSTEAPQKAPKDPLLETIHHEISQSLIKDNINIGLQDREGFEAVANKMMSKERFKTGIIEATGLNKPPEDQLPKEKHGEALGAGMIYPPNILVKGPRDAKRIDATGKKFDEPIVRQQTPEHQTAVRHANDLMEQRAGNPALDSLSDVSPAKPVPWMKIDNPVQPTGKKKNQPVKEYYVKPPEVILSF